MAKEPETQKTYAAAQRRSVMVWERLAGPVDTVDEATAVPVTGSENGGSVVILVYIVPAAPDGSSRLIARAEPLGGGGGS